jgi:hypothetical protein
MTIILGSPALRGYTARGGVMALLERLPASTLATVLVDLHESLCDEVGEELAALVTEAGIINCGQEEWRQAIEAAEDAFAAGAGSLVEIDAFGFAEVQHAL